MKAMVVSELKAKCIAVLRLERRSGEPSLISRLSRFLTRVEPVGDTAFRRRLGVHRGPMRIEVGVVHGRGCSNPCAAPLSR